ncbi:MAG: helix-turn-helix domain-containing protein [Candidatus Caldatribacterium sp.]|uniref:ArsR/SmtB family transcription factor n=1 Tax=Candidatus Caldatribacterium sp. TaxID=2282143 RepID=UPI00299A177F|nr:helix-turn-helix domain-containing protein [Candidatus Caldatribacterium sp.]MCX7730627.1 helix-turn-helix domain-containing protein [Candidatus Caldatribacterium sp.]MDW8081128.1 helix-turn-helix domain-containing protein [Candidatus Calescibacterium sp.]
MLRKSGSILVLNTDKDVEVLKALGSELRIRILELLNGKKLNVNEIAQALGIPQSTAAVNIKALERAGLVKVENTKGKKGSQKLCSAQYSEIVIAFSSKGRESEDDVIEVEMPVGLYTKFDVSPPCGLCSKEKIIGFLDAPDSFWSPERVKAGLLWFERGFVEYKFPNNALYKRKPLKRIEVQMELSSEVPGTNENWPSDITLWINEVEVGTWTSPGDFGDRRGRFTPLWWKLEGSQYGLLKTWIVTEEGSFVDGERVSDITLKDLDIYKHSSIKVRIGIREDAKNVGGINIFGRGFGNYDQDIVLRLYF